MGKINKNERRPAPMGRMYCVCAAQRCVWTAPLCAAQRCHHHDDKGAKRRGEHAYLMKMHICSPCSLKYGNAVFYKTLIQYKHAITHTALSLTHGVKRGERHRSPLCQLPRSPCAFTRPSVVR